MVWLHLQSIAEVALCRTVDFEDQRRDHKSQIARNADRLWGMDFSQEPMEEEEAVFQILDVNLVKQVY